jgi:cell division protein FtsN
VPRDYKHVPKQKADHGSGSWAGVLTFITGLALGLLVAFLVYLKQSDGSYLPFKAIPDTREAQTDMVSPELTQYADPEQIQQQEPPEPSFDFYSILPNKEINISEWVAEEFTDTDETILEEDSVYILQVGSFKQFDAADQVKAQLALLGISADIQRVVINGQDTRYRVRIGPFNDQSSLNVERRRLQENNLEFMLLKLQADDPHLQ